MTQPKHILLFDGVCNLCNTSIQFVLKNNKKENIYFATLQSEVGVQLMQQYQIDANTINSLVFINEQKVYTKSSGALQLSKNLKMPYRLLATFLIIPKPIRDAVYNLVAQKRYAWFGKQATCWLPNPKWKHRFLS